LAANSWQQTPAGFTYRNGRAELINFWAAVFNPSTWPRFFHTMAAALVTGGFFVAGVSSLLLLKNKHSAIGKVALTIALPFTLIAAVLVAVPTGHSHARQVAVTQPEKFAVMEGLFKTEKNPPLVAFGLVQTDPPDLKARIDIPIPGLLGWLAFGDSNAEVKGIDAFPPQHIPPLWLTFVSFHNMVALGMLFIAVSALGVIKLIRGTLWRSRWLLLTLFIVSPLPLAANEFGWVAAEVGRQPWIVYKFLRTNSGISPNLTAGQVWISLLAFALIYILLLALYIFVILREVQRQSETNAEVG
jgi:cytochrome d ubiquinol oxidase subunit I